MPPKNKSANQPKSNKTRSRRGKNVSKKVLPKSVNADSKQRNKRKQLKGNADDSHKKAKLICDKYCWECHQPCQEKKCRNCFRIYHFSCIKNWNHLSNICQECQLQLDSRSDIKGKISDDMLLELLKMVIENSFKVKSKKNNPLLIWRNVGLEQKILNEIDCRYIIDRSKDACGLQYKSPADLLSDVKWLHHNAVIVYGKNSAVAKESGLVLQKFQSEIEDMNLCLICYYRENKRKEENKISFHEPCTAFHPIVFLKMKGHSSWPAKCYRVVDGKAQVKFFQSHQRCKVPLKDIYFLAEEHMKIKTKSAKLAIAINELKEYMRLFKSRFDEYPFQEPGQLIDPVALENMKDLVKNNVVSNADVSLTSQSIESHTDSYMSATPSTSYRSANVRNHNFEEIDSGNFRQNIGRLMPGINITNMDLWSQEEDTYFPDEESDITIVDVVSTCSLNTNSSTNEPKGQLMEPGNNSLGISSRSSNFTSTSKNLTHEVDDNSDIEIIDCKPTTVGETNMFLSTLCNGLKENPQIIVSLVHKFYENLKSEAMEAARQKLKDEAEVEKLKEKQRNLISIVEKYEAFLKDSEQEKADLTSQIHKLEEDIKDAKTNDFCSVCLNPSSTICCSDGLISFKFCSHSCLENSKHKESCKKYEQPKPQQSSQTQFQMRTVQHTVQTECTVKTTIS